MLKQVRRALFAAFLFSGFINLLMLATPLYTLQVFETVVPLGSIETLVILTAIVAVSIVALALIEIARDNVLLRAGLWLDHELGQHMLENGLRAGSAPADLKQDARALDQFRSFVTSSAVTALFDAPWVPIFLLALFALHPAIGLIALASAILLGMVALVQSLAAQRLQREAGRANERADQWWSMIADNAQLAGALGLSRGASEQWELMNRAHVAGAYSLGKRSSFLKAVARAVRIGSQIAIYGIGAWLVVDSQITPGALVASAILLARALAPLEQMVGAVKVAEAAWRAYQRLKALPADVKETLVAASETMPRRGITLAEVTYYHPGRKTPALRSASLSLAPGECLGIAGPSGAGKSTLAQLLAGAVLPTTGSAELDGVPITSWQRHGGQPAIGYLPDEPGLVEGSVLANIARFRDASLMSVARAGLRAGVHEIIAALPQGYDTAIGPGGASLSLGERRAVALARALHGDPRIVVLDEPEIGLDGARLRQLRRVLADLKAEGVSLVIATQDPRLLAIADKVAVLNGGAIQAMTPPAELTRKSAPREAGARSEPAAEQAGLH
jgi:PrtD family type I secretion system ABC transporter